MILTLGCIGAVPGIFGRASIAHFSRWKTEDPRIGTPQNAILNIFTDVVIYPPRAMSSNLVEKPPSEKDAEKEARKRVAEIKSFYGHLLTYMLVNLMLVGIYLATGSDHFWPIYPMLGWGIGLVSHAASTFGAFGVLNASWEERKVRELILQKEHGLSADQVRALLKKEMANERTLLPSADELRRIDDRLQNLEAIVTSRDWDELPSHSELLRTDTKDNLSSEESDPDPAEDAARLARRVR